MKATPNKALIERAHRARQQVNPDIAKELSKSINTLEALPEDKAALEQLEGDIVRAEAWIDLSKAMQ